MEQLHFGLNILQHLPEHIAQWTNTMGPWVYALLFSIIFAETGFVFTPFLPGDSLLFAAGALTVGADSALDLTTLIVLLLIAAITGDLLNYSIGRKLGTTLFRNPNSKLFNKNYLERTEEFYVNHGGKAVILARFLPIIRTYAPFVAGTTRMRVTRYLRFNVIGATLWICGFLIAGHVFGNIPAVKDKFHFVILAILVISVAPAVIQFARSRSTSARGSNKFRL
jgi:membrane-associated protein